MRWDVQSPDASPFHDKYVLVATPTQHPRDPMSCTSAHETVAFATRNERVRDGLSPKNVDDR